MNYCVVIRVGKLGDHIVALPAISVLCSKYRHIYILCDKNNFPGKEIYDAVDLSNITVMGLFDIKKIYYEIIRKSIARVFVMPQRDSNIKTKLKIILYCLALFPLSKINYNFIKAKKLMGFYEADRCIGFISSVIDSKEAIAVWNNKLNQLKIKYRLLDTNKYSAVIHADASIEKKKWPWENFNKIRLSLQKPDKKVLVIKQNSSNLKSNQIYFKSRLSMVDLFTVISNAELFLGTDSGPMQIAIILGTRVFALQSSHDTKGAWFPEEGPFKGLWSLCVRYELECSGCRYKACTSNYKCTNGITPKEIINYVKFKQRVS